MTFAEAALLRARRWKSGPRCLLCGSTRAPVTQIVTVHCGTEAIPGYKCRPCVVRGFAIQRDTAQALGRATPRQRASQGSFPVRETCGPKPLPSSRIPCF
jgi:hypothetical protein